MHAFSVLIPVNRLDRAKARLAEVLSPEQRAELALATLITTWEAARELTEQVFILTADPRVPALLGPRARIIEESLEAHGLNGQLQLAVDGMAAQVEAGRVALLILHADLPLANPGAIERLMAALPEEPGAALVRSGDGGTNAMAAIPVPGFELRYGKHSAARHEEAARTAGYTVSLHSSPDLELDLDTPADLEALLRDPRGAATRAGRALVAMNLPSRLGARA